MSGIECVRKVQKTAASLDFVNVYNPFWFPWGFEALRAGAKGYILKEAVLTGLFRIYDIADGGSPMSPQISRLVAESFNEANKRNPDIEKLSKQEGSA